jgi:AcrR family transcriptional regulator
MARIFSDGPRVPGKRIGISHDQIVQLAADIADREGLAAVTLARLALLSGARTPSISHHVGSLRQLRADIALLAVEQLTESIKAAGADKLGEEAVRAMYRAYRAFVHTYPGRYTASIETPDPADARRLAAAGRLARYLGNAFGQIGLHGDDASRAARLLRSAVHGYATLEMKSAWQMPLDDDATFDWLLNVILAGLTANE